MAQGSGVVVILDGTLKGGDSLMYYVGTFKETENQFTADFYARKHTDRTDIRSVFGLDEVHLTVQGTSTDTSVDVTGTAAEVPEVQFQAQLNLLE